ncbi:SDR family NAD(P)-dependent oxidoreductase [Paenibacillus sp. BJ-4]|uniref:SDR family NAD(P)-dependent oxidoreductase n=1 Tax=Paenibacillus sp. BJ-4 TaxID=2878097 RepID=UPI001CF0B42C|nr:SDR family NAD(P)-dependent oxidoreductase [Paenibacillus sp. BJ-4]
MIVDVSNKVVVITGSSRGIGSELAKAFAKEKSKVVINYFNSKDKAQKLFREISKCNQDCMLIKADVTNPSDVSKMYHEVVNKYGCVDVLINNAGVCDDNLIQMMPLEQWQKVIDVNLTGTFLCCREFSKIMIKQKSGKIINMASLKGQEGAVGQINYTASKAGIISLTKTLAKELGQYNIAVNAVCPGFIVTDLNRHDKYKIEIAENKSILPINSNLNELMNFIIYISSNLFIGISGRVFNLDSRL